MLLATAACGKDTSSPAPSPVLGRTADPAQGMLQPASSADPSLREEKASPFNGSPSGPAVYRSRERRDPFRLPRVATADMPQTVHLKLTGIIREPHSYSALVESESSPGLGYVIRENDVVDSAKVVRITKDKVVFEVYAKNSEGKLLTRYVEKQMLSVEATTR